MVSDLYANGICKPLGHPALYVTFMLLKANEEINMKMWS